MMKVPLSLVGKIEVISKAKSRRIIAGYGNIAVVDSQKQFIPLETLKAGLNTLLSDMSYANLMLSHNNVQVGKILKSYGKLTTHVDDKGLYILAELRTDIETANETWEKILKGEINGFSIGCEVLSDPREVCDANGCVTYLDKINILEVSICSHPVNQMSGFTVISKSDSISQDVCKSCDIMVEIMSEEKIEEQKVEIKEEPKELSTEERLEAMERSIFNIMATLEKLSSKEEEKKPESVEVPPEEVAPVKAEETPKVEEVPKVEPIKSEEPPKIESTIFTKKDFEDGIAKLIEALKSDTKMKSEMELAIKAKDEVIENQKKQLEVVATKEQIKTIEKAEENSEPKTVQDILKEKEFGTEKDCPIVIKNGEVTSRRFV